MTTALRALLGYLRPYRRHVVALIVLLLVELAWAVVFSLSFQFVLDRAIAAHDRAMLRAALIVLPTAAVVAAAAAVARDYLYARLGTGVMNDLRLRMFAHLQGLGAGFYAKAKTGDLMARFSTDLAAVETAIILAVPETVLGLLGVVAISALLFVFSPSLALFALLGMPLVIAGPKLLGARAERRSYQVRAAEADLASAVAENINAQPVVRAFGLGATQVGAFQTQLSCFGRSSLTFNLLAYLVERTPNVAFLLLQITVFSVGAVQCFDGALTVGELCTFNVLITFLGSYITSLTRVLPPLLAASGGIRRIEDLLATRPSVTDAPAAEPLPPLRQAITFTDVVFSYDGEHRSLDRVDLRIPAGANVVIVGGSGSGKSTVLGLLARFHDPDSGTVGFDGTDLRGARVDTLRNQVGMVFQESFLFNTTIRENIRLGRPGATDAEVEAAARDAEVDAFVAALPDGYDTLVGERGGRLSGGQRQRVAIARAMLRDPAILLLDEATSALDPATEAAVNATLRRLWANRTVVSVTHRLASTVDADLVLVMADGRLVESGSPAELLVADGCYRQMWDSQLTGGQDGRSGVVATPAGVVPTAVASPHPLQLRKATPMNSTAHRNRATVSPKLEVRRDAANSAVFATSDIEPGEVLIGLAHSFVGDRDRHTIQVGDGIHQAFTDEADDYVNHSCDPNAWLDAERLEVVALRSIVAGEEIRQNYLTFEPDMSSPFACQCAASACVGEVRGYLHLTSAQQEALAPWVFPHVRAAAQAHCAA